jgi:hypothetical protein
MKKQIVVNLRVQQLMSTDGCNSDTGDISSEVNQDTTDESLGIRFVVLQVSETFCNTNGKFMKHKTIGLHDILHIIAHTIQASYSWSSHQSAPHW